MTSGAWFVLFPKSKTPRRDVVLAKLREIRGASVTSHGDAFEFTVTVGSASFDVALNAKRT